MGSLSGGTETVRDENPPTVAVFGQESFLSTVEKKKKRMKGNHPRTADANRSGSTSPSFTELKNDFFFKYLHS